MMAIDSGRIDVIDFFLLICFGGIFALLPWNMQEASFRGLLIILSAYSVFLMKDRSWLQLLPLMFFIIPQQLNDEVSDNGIMGLIKYFMYYCSFIVLLLLFLRKHYTSYKKRNFRFAFLCVLFLLILSIFYMLFISGDRKDVYAIVYFFILYLCFYLVLKKSVLSYNYFYYAMDVLFYILSVYAIIEFFWQTTPYDDIYYASLNGDYYSITQFLRVKSLCGHALIFVAFLVIYQITLYTRMIINKSKIVYIHLIILFFVSLLTLSRTIYIIEAAVFLTYFFLSAKYFSTRKFNKMITVVIIVGIVSFIGYDMISMSLERFSSSDTSETNRFSAFQAAFTIFQNEPLGVGESLQEMYKKYHNQLPPGFTVDVLDNGFLAMLCQYGIFTPFYIIPLLCPVIDTYREVRKDKSCRLVFWITSISFLLLSFSFIIIKYTSVLMLVAVHYAIINHILNGRISNNC